MSIVDLFKWTLEGSFWRWCGAYTFLLAIVTGGRVMFTDIIASIFRHLASLAHPPKT